MKKLFEKASRFFNLRNIEKETIEQEHKLRDEIRLNEKIIHKSENLNLKKFEEPEPNKNIHIKNRINEWGDVDRDNVFNKKRLKK